MYVYVPFSHLSLSFEFIECESKAFDVNSAVSQPQLVGDPVCTGVAPLAAYSVAATLDVSANAPDGRVHY